MLQTILNYVNEKGIDFTYLCFSTSCFTPYLAHLVNQHTFFLLFFSSAPKDGAQDLEMVENTSKLFFSPHTEMVESISKLLNRDCGEQK